MINVEVSEGPGTGAGAAGAAMAGGGETGVSEELEGAEASEDVSDAPEVIEEPGVGMAAME